MNQQQKKMLLPPTIGNEKNISESVVETKNNVEPKIIESDLTDQEFLVLKKLLSRKEAEIEERKSSTKKEEVVETKVVVKKKTPTKKSSKAKQARINIRCTEKEKIKIKNNSGKKAVSEFLLDLGLRNKYKLSEYKISIAKEDVKLLNELHTNNVKIGNNINILARDTREIASKMLDNTPEAFEEAMNQLPTILAEIGKANKDLEKIKSSISSISSGMLKEIQEFNKTADEKKDDYKSNNFVIEAIAEDNNGAG